VRVEVLSDEDLGKIILDSAMVVLPYRHMYNSGAALLSLTLGRPILVPASPTMLELQHEVGERWVHLYVGELTADDVRRALRAIEGPAAEGPNLGRRDWGRVAGSYAELYARLVGPAGSLARPGRGVPPVDRREGSLPLPVTRLRQGRRAAEFGSSRSATRRPRRSAAL